MKAQDGNGGASLRGHQGHTELSMLRATAAKFPESPGPHMPAGPAAENRGLAEHLGQQLCGWQGPLQPPEGPDLGAGKEFSAGPASCSRGQPEALSAAAGVDAEASPSRSPLLPCISGGSGGAVLQDALQSPAESWSQSPTSSCSDCAPFPSTQLHCHHQHYFLVGKFRTSSG